MVKLRQNQIRKGKIITFNVPGELGLRLREKEFQRYIQVALKRRPGWKVLINFLNEGGAGCLKKKEGKRDR